MTGSRRMLEEPKGGTAVSFFFIHSAVFLFGFAGLFPRWLPLPSIWIVSGRTLFATLFFLLLAWMGKLSIPKPRWGEWFFLSATGMLLALHWVAFFRSIQLSSVALGLLAYSSFPVFVVALEPLVSRERFHLRNLWLVPLTGIGMLLLASPLSEIGKSLPALAWGILSGATFAGLIVSNRYLARTFNGLQVAFYQDFFAFLTLSPFLFKDSWRRLSPRHIVILAVLGVVCTAIAHSLFIQGMKRVKGQSAGFIALAEPIYGILFAFFLFSEIPSTSTIAGGVIILGAALWVTIFPD